MNEELIRRHKTVVDGYRVRAAAHLAAVWDSLPSYDEAGIERFRRDTAAVLAGAKRAAVAQAVAFVGTALGVRTPSVSPSQVPVAAKLDDPFHAAWHAVKVGRPWEEAVVVGRSTAEAVGIDFVQSTTRLTGDVVAERVGRQVRWRRVPSSGACDWCHEISDKTYRSAAAADFGHERCDCDAVPE